MLFCHDLLSQPGHVSKGKQNFLLSGRLSCSTFRQKDFSEEVSRLAAAPRRLSINHMYEEWWLHFAGWATKQGIDSLGPTTTQVAAFLLSLCRDYGLAPQVVLGLSTPARRRWCSTELSRTSNCLDGTPACYDHPPAWDLSMAFEVLFKVGY